RRAPFEELLDIFGYIADGRLPVVEEDLHIDGLRIGADELRLRAGLCAHAPARRIPLRTLLHGVFARIELEVQPAHAVDLFELRHPVGGLLRVFVHRAGELDVLVLRPSWNPVDEGVLTALLVLEDVIFDGEAIALRPVAEIPVAIDLDSESQALSVGVVCHGLLISAGRSGIRLALDRSAAPSATGCGSGRRAFQRAHPYLVPPLVGGPGMMRRRRPPIPPRCHRPRRPMTWRARPARRRRRRSSRTRRPAGSARRGRAADRPARPSNPTSPGLPTCARCWVA